MGNPFAKCNQKGESFSGLWKSRAHKSIHLYWTSDDLFGGETLMGGGNISCIKSQTVNGLDSRFPPGSSSWSSQDKNDKQYHIHVLTELFHKTDNKKDVIVSDFEDHKKWKPLVSLSPTLIVWIPALQQFSLLYSKVCGCGIGRGRIENIACFSFLEMSGAPSNKVFSCRETYSWTVPSSHIFKHQIHHQSSSLMEEQLDPFSLVADELSVLANRLRSMVIAEVPKLASAAEYFFKMGVEGKRFRPTVTAIMLMCSLFGSASKLCSASVLCANVLLLMATALNVRILETTTNSVGDALTTELRRRQQSIAEITEMIHVASLLHDDVLDDADTRRGIGSLNFVMGNKVAVLAGDFLLSRACVALASLKNTEVVTLLATVVEHLVTGETMQMTSTSEQRCSMEYYMQKTYYKTASLISNSCKAIALLAGQTTEVAMLAFEYGKNLGLAFQLIDDVLDFTGTSASLGKGSLSDIRHGIVTAPLLFAMEEFPQLRSVIDWGFDKPENIDVALEYLGKSRGIQRTRELAAKHANLAAAAIDSLPETDDEEVLVNSTPYSRKIVTERWIGVAISIPWCYLLGVNRFVIKELLYKGEKVQWLYNQMIKILFSVLTSTGADANIPITKQ
ncbi:hypothetical protein SADUNF_Sadunf10G0104900 [Salix dunnii]|uniref:Uncharacterized protein n=1 Tax=Salix dunnii TaxID=1413687 RepID=A0A835JN62_9ROSI|nr:hypothetical protein SADUNF_Sadunf10G0104900 [Salix dunnii]